MGRLIRALILVAVLVGLGVLAGSALSQWWEVPGASAADAVRASAADAVRASAADAVRAITAPRERERVRVEVLNAAGLPKLARTATDALRDVGFDVVYFGNAGSFDRGSSVVLDRVGDVAAARAVADALGIRSVRSEPDSNLFVDVSVLLGKAWTLPPAGSQPVPGEEPPPERPWWDLRRFAPRQRAQPPAAAAPGSAMANPTGTEEIER